LLGAISEIHAAKIKPIRAERVIGQQDIVAYEDLDVVANLADIVFFPDYSVTSITLILTTRFDVCRRF